jgi:hypothetical protein
MKGSTVLLVGAGALLVYYVAKKSSTVKTTPLPAPAPAKPPPTALDRFVQFWTGAPWAPATPAAPSTSWMSGVWDQFFASAKVEEEIV